MDEFLTRLESQFTELATRISRLEPVEDQPAKFADLDNELVGYIAGLREQYAACKQIDELQKESQELDTSINSILIQLGNCRKQLEQLPSAPSVPPTTVDSQTLLDYATKITRFTRKIPGTVDPAVLPWPTEDWLRRGMLATLTIQDEQQQQQQHEQEQHKQQQLHEQQEEAQQQEQAHQQQEVKEPAKQRGSRRQAKPKAKISLDFDSDDD